MPLDSSGDQDFSHRPDVTGGAKDTLRKVLTKQKFWQDYHKGKIQAPDSVINTQDETDQADTELFIAAYSHTKDFSDFSEEDRKQVADVTGGFLDNQGILHRNIRRQYYSDVHDGEDGEPKFVKASHVQFSDKFEDFTIQHESGQRTEKIVYNPRNDLMVSLDRKEGQFGLVREAPNPIVVAEGYERDSEDLTFFFDSKTGDARSILYSVMYRMPDGDGHTGLTIGLDNDEIKRVKEGESFIINCEGQRLLFSKEHTPLFAYVEPDGHGGVVINVLGDNPAEVRGPLSIDIEATLDKLGLSPDSSLRRNPGIARADFPVVGGKPVDFDLPWRSSSAQATFGISVRQRDPLSGKPEKTPEE